MFSVSYGLVWLQSFIHQSNFGAVGLNWGNGYLYSYVRKSIWSIVLYDLVWFQSARNLTTSEQVDSMEETVFRIPMWRIRGCKIFSYSMLIHGHRVDISKSLGSWYLLDTCTMGASKLVRIETFGFWFILHWGNKRILVNPTSCRTLLVLVRSMWGPRMLLYACQELVCGFSKSIDTDFNSWTCLNFDCPDSLSWFVHLRPIINQLGR